jgi:hypothetical protein
VKFVLLHAYFNVKWGEAVEIASLSIKGSGQSKKYRLFTEEKKPLLDKGCIPFHRNNQELLLNLDRAI